MIKKILYFILINCVLISCESGRSETKDSINYRFVKGADISWLPQMEASGFKFYNSSGKEDDCLNILQSNGINTVRLRTWVNPSDDPLNGHCSAAELVSMVVRAKSKGFRVMVDFHYSDTWADPGKQVKPASWESLDFIQLTERIHIYTKEVLTELKNANVYPEWIQVGNEINPGMLLPDGSSQNMSNLSQLINSAYDAVKEVFPDSLVIIHLANGTDNGLFRWFFDGLTRYSTKYDVIGFSYYPYWDKKKYTETINRLKNNMYDMISRYDKKVMIVETGGLDSEPDETYTMLTDVITLVRNIPDEKGLGVLYWEPQGAAIWSKYRLSCWGNDGVPEKPIEAFKK